MSIRQTGSNDASLAARAHALVKERIIRCEYAPGQRVTENELVATFGIGKTPVREALGRLASEGLVISLPRHGYEVAPITLRDVRELFGLRLVVEPAAVRLAAGHVDAVSLRHLDQLCQADYDLGNHESAARFLAANRELHETIAAASGNARLAAVVRSTLENCERLFHLGLMIRDRSEEMAHEHKDLVEALVAGDGEAASQIAIEQIVAAERMVVDAILMSPSLLATSIELIGSTSVGPGPVSLRAARSRSTVARVRRGGRRLSS